MSRGTSEQYRLGGREEIHLDIERAGRKSKPCGNCLGACLLGGCAVTTVCALVLLVIALATVNIASIVIGAIHANDCPARPDLGKILISMGSLSIILSLFGKSGDNENKCVAVLRGLVGLAVLGLFIYMCVMVYGVHSTVTYDDPSMVTTYCHKTLFLYSFWFLNILLGSIAVSLVFGCCALCVAGCK